MKANTPELMKFQRLQRMLRESRRGIIGLLEGMWLAVSKNCPDGGIGRFTDEEIAIMCDWENDPTELVAALVKCGWLDPCEVNRLKVHDWVDHCPRYIKGGIKTKEKAEQALGSKPITIAHSYKPQAKAIGLKHPAKPSLTKPNQAKPILTKSEDSSAVAKPTTKPPSVENPVLEFPCVGQQKIWGLAESQISGWSELYPSLDVLAECRKALAWVQANERKTASGMPKFLVRWLNKASDGSRSRSGSVEGKQFLTPAQQREENMRKVGERIAEAERTGKPFLAIGGSK